MPALLLLAILGSSQEKYDKVAARIRFPREEMDTWGRRGDAERRVIADIGAGS